MGDKRLTIRMMEVLELLGAGWTVTQHPYIQGITAQKGGDGKGGESKNINQNTVVALQDRGLIKSVWAGYGKTTHWELTAAGREI